MVLVVGVAAEGAAGLLEAPGMVEMPALIGALSAMSLHYLKSDYLVGLYFISL